MAITAFAPCSAACCNKSSNASSRVFSQRFVRRVILPPMIVCRVAPRVPMTLRDLTIIPLTIPKFLTIRYPGNSVALVTIEKSTRFIFAPPCKTFTGAILSVHGAVCEPRESAILGLDGEPIRYSGCYADPAGFLSDRARTAMARLRAPARRNRPWFLYSAHGGVVPLQGAGARTRAESGRAL